MTHLLVDASSNGVCLRCHCTGEIIDLKNLRLTYQLLNSLITWIQKYKELNASDSIDYLSIDTLDKEGINMALCVKIEIPDLQIAYQSDTLLIDACIALKHCS